MKTKSFFFNATILFTSVFLTGCFSTIVLPINDEVNKNGGQVVSYKKKDGDIVSTVPQGFKYENAVLSKDTLTIEISRRSPYTKTRYYSERKIPLDEILSIRTIPRQLRYGSVGAGVVSIRYMNWEYSRVDKYLGYSLNLALTRIKAINLPDDYIGSEDEDRLTILSFLGTLKSPTIGDDLFCFGIDVGPSLILYRENLYRPNPDYNPNAIFFKEDNYLIHYRGHEVIGILCKGEIGILFTKHFGVEISIWSNVNKFKSCSGIGLNLVFGRLK